MSSEVLGEYTGARQRVVFGVGSRSRLGDELVALEVDRALLVTGPTVAASGLVDEVLAHTGRVAVTVCDGSREHVPHSAVLAAIEAARRADVDAVISLGGSSPVGVAKAVALGLADPGFADGSRPLSEPADTPMPPVVAVTTTLSQSEFTHIVGTSDDVTGEKRLHADHGLLPRLVVLDGELAVPTPHRLWASTGVKALDSGVGGHVQQVPQLFRDPVNIAAVGELVRLLQALADGEDGVDARQRLQVAAWMAMFPRFQLPTTRPNPPGMGWFGAAARHQLGGATRVPHGELGGVLLPAAIAFHRGEEGAGGRLAELAAPLGLDPAGLAERARALVAALGLPTTLGELGIRAEQVDSVVDAILREQPSLADRRDEVEAALASVT